MITTLNEFRKVNENIDIENIERLSQRIKDILNVQIKNELQSSLIYMGITCFLDDAGRIGASKYYFKAANEELKHMNKIYEYLFDRNVKAIVPTTEPVKQQFANIREVVQASLEHEMTVTQNWENISELAKSENDNTTYEFAQWFLSEQIEEENKFREILFKMDLDMPEWKIDELFEELLDKIK